MYVDASSPLRMRWAIVQCHAWYQGQWPSIYLYYVGTHSILSAKGRWGWGNHTTPPSSQLLCKPWGLSPRRRHIQNSNFESYVHKKNSSWFLTNWPSVPCMRTSTRWNCLSFTCRSQTYATTEKVSWASDNIHKSNDTLSEGSSSRVFFLIEYASLLRREIRTSVKRSFEKIFICQFAQCII